MTQKQFIIIILFGFIILANSRLAYVATVFRHGARYPTSDMYDGKETK